MNDPLGPLVDVEPYLTFQIRNAHLALQRDITAALRPLGITPEAFYVLCTLHRAPDQTPTALAKLVGVQLPNLHGLLKRLHSAGFVEQGLSRDQRSKVLHLTQRGEGLRSRALTLWFNHIGRVERCLGDQPQDDLNSALKRLARLRPSLND